MNTNKFLNILRSENGLFNLLWPKFLMPLCVLSFLALCAAIYFNIGSWLVTVPDVNENTGWVLVVKVAFGIVLGFNIPLFMESLFSLAFKGSREAHAFIRKKLGIEITRFFNLFLVLINPFFRLCFCRLFWLEKTWNPLSRPGSRLVDSEYCADFYFYLASHTSHSIVGRRLK